MKADQPSLEKPSPLSKSRRHYPCLLTAQETAVTLSSFQTTGFFLLRVGQNSDLQEEERRADPIYSQSPSVHRACKPGQKWSG